MLVFIVFLSLLLFSTFTHAAYTIKKPSVLLVSDIDYTWIGLSSSKIANTVQLYGESFWDDAYTWFNTSQYGKVWGIAPGLVPDLQSLVTNNILGADSILSSQHPDFGSKAGRFTTSFGVNSDGGSMKEFEYNVTDPTKPYNFGNLYRKLRSAQDFHPAAHVLDSAVTCYGKFNETATNPDVRLLPVQEHCITYDRKDIMMQNILDYYFHAGFKKFDYILFVDDQGSNLHTVKHCPHLPHQEYKWGPSETIDASTVKLAYPHGGTGYIVQSREDGEPPNCAACWYPTTCPLTGSCAWQALKKGFSAEAFYDDVHSSTFELYGEQAFPIESLHVRSVIPLIAMISGAILFLVILRRQKPSSTIYTNIN